MTIMRWALTALLVVTAAGCASSGGRSVEPPGAPAASVAVERFLQLANAKDYLGMGGVFGTTSGAVLARDPPAEVERRMYALASLLSHEGFVVGNGVPVPGRTAEVVAFDVIMSQGGRDLRVPFTAVRGPADRWYVESLDVVAVTSR